MESNVYLLIFICPHQEGSWEAGEKAGQLTQYSLLILGLESPVSFFLVGTLYLIARILFLGLTAHLGFYLFISIIILFWPSHLAWTSGCPRFSVWTETLRVLISPVDTWYHHLFKQLPPWPDQFFDSSLYWYFPNII